MGLPLGERGPSWLVYAYSRCLPLRRDNTLREPSNSRDTCFKITYYRLRPTQRWSNTIIHNSRRQRHWGYLGLMSSSSCIKKFTYRWYRAGWLRRGRKYCTAVRGFWLSTQASGAWYGLWGNLVWWSPTGSAASSFIATSTISPR